MPKPSARQSDDPQRSAAAPSRQLWTSAACPVVDHDARPESEASSSCSALSPRCAGIMAASGGIAVANLYYNQPMLPEIGRRFGVDADVVPVLPMLTQIGYALGLFLFVPLGDVVDRHRLVAALLCGIIVSLLALALAPSLVWLDIASLTLGMTSAVAQVLVVFAAQLRAPQQRGQIIGTLQAGIIAAVLLARTVSGTMSAHLGWRPMFWLPAAMNLGALVVLHRLLRGTPPPAPQPYVRVLRSLKDLWRSY